MFLGSLKSICRTQSNLWPSLEVGPESPKKWGVMVPIKTHFDSFSSPSCSRNHPKSCTTKRLGCLPCLPSIYQHLSTAGFRNHPEYVIICLPAISERSPRPRAEPWIDHPGCCKVGWSRSRRKIAAISQQLSGDIGKSRTGIDYHDIISYEI